LTKIPIRETLVGQLQEATMKDRILASTLRRKLEGHPGPQRIAALMTDAELVERYLEFGAAAIAHAQTKSQEKPLADLYSRALATA
jgi:hypothetical protein